MPVTVRGPVDASGRETGGEGSRSNAVPGLYGSRLTAVAFAVVLLAMVDCAAYTYGGSPWGIAALVASVIAIAAWMLTTLGRPASPPAAFPLYIGTVTSMMLFEAEEWYRGMPSQLMRLYPNAFPAGVGITEHAFIAVFPLTLSAFLVLGALTYYHATAFGRFCAWLTFAWGLTASVSVYAYVLGAGSPFHYMGGMISAPVVVFLSVAGMIRLVRCEGRDAFSRTAP